MHPLLLPLLLSTPALAATPFAKEDAEVYFERGAKPTLAELRASNWTQIAGLPLYDPARATWVAGPVGRSDSGVFPALEVFTKKIQQLKTILEFTGEGLLLQTFDPDNGNPAAQFKLAAEEKAVSLGFTLKHEGNWQMNASFPRNADEFSANFDCRKKGPDLLVCAATLQAKDEALAGPTLRPHVGKVFYYSLYQKGKGLPGSSAAMQAAPPGKINAFKCAMAWAPGKAEIMSFTLLAKPVKLGKLKMFGVGETWDPANPKVRDKVIVVTVSNDGWHNDVSILKPEKNLYPFDANFALEEHLKNPQGLYMPGTISIPKGGGYSPVGYPPGWAQGPKWYADSLKTAPSGAECREFSVAEPADPYFYGAGSLP